jgi:phosphoribosylformylglycinamidine synthase
MTISTNQLEKLKEIALKHHVEITNIGRFNQSDRFEVTRKGKLVASLDLDFLHGGVPTLTLDSEYRHWQGPEKMGKVPPNLKEILLKLLAHPNLCNRESVIRQYDHEVQGSSVIKPLMGRRQKAPCDASVITPILGSSEGLAISNGINPRLAKYDGYLMAVCAVDEAVRNLICVGADPASISLLDNFCWPDPVESERNRQGKAYLGTLVRSCQGLHEAATAFEAPLISGKDSMKNDFDDGVLRISILPTLLISAMGKVPNVEQCLSMEFKDKGDLIYLLSAGTLGLAGSHYEECLGWQSNLLCSVDLTRAKTLYAKLHEAIGKGWLKSAHDLAEGGLAAALSECIIGGGMGSDISIAGPAESGSSASPDREDLILFGEGPARLLVSINPGYRSDFESLWDRQECFYLGEVTDTATLEVKGKNGSSLVSVSLAELEQAWNIELPFA